MKKQGFLYGGIVLMISMLIVKIIGAFFKIPLTNILGLQGIGYFSSAYNVYIVFYALTVTGLSSATARIVAEKKAQHRYKDVKRVFKLSLIVFSLIGVIASTVIIKFVTPFSSLISSINSKQALLMIAPAVLFCCLMAAFRGYYEGLLNMVPTAVVQVVEAVSKLFFGLFFANIAINYFLNDYSSFTPKEELYVMSLPYAAAGAMLGVSIGTVLGFIYLLLYYGITRKKKLSLTNPINETEPYKDIFINLFKTALPITLSAVVLQLSSLIDTITIQKRLLLCEQRSPNYMLSQYGNIVSGNENITEILYGAFVTCVSIFNILPAFSGIFAKSGLPSITTLWAKREHNKLNKKINEIIKITAILVAPMASTLLVMPNEVVRLLFKITDERILLTGNILSMLSLSAFFLAVTIPANSIFQAVNKPRTPLNILLVGVLIKLVLNVWLCGNPKINIYGGAISTFWCYFFIFVATFVKLKAINDVKIKLLETTILPLCLAILSNLIVKILIGILNHEIKNTMLLITYLSVSPIIYIIFLFLFKVIRKKSIISIFFSKKKIKPLEK